MITDTQAAEAFWRLEVDLDGVDRTSLGEIALFCIVSPCHLAWTRVIRIDGETLVYFEIRLEILDFPCIWV